MGECKYCGKPAGKYTYVCTECDKKPKGMNNGGGVFDKRGRDHDIHGSGYDNRRDEAAGAGNH